MHDYSDLPIDEMHALYNDTYAQIVGEGQLKVVNEEKTKTMVKQFINFADQLVQIRAARKNKDASFLIEKKADIIVKPVSEIQPIIDDTVNISL